MRPQCTSCGSSLPRAAAFCHRCGALVASPAAVQVETKSRRRRKRRPHIPPTAIDRDDTPEQVIWQDTFSAKGLIQYALMLAVGSVAAFVVALGSGANRDHWIWGVAALGSGWGLFGAYVLYLKLNVYYVLTTQRLIHRHGILTRCNRRIEVIDVDDVNYRQGILERLVGVGTIEIYSSDISDPMIEMPGIDCVHEVAQLIDDARRAERVRRGIHIEAV